MGIIDNQALCPAKFMIGYNGIRRANHEEIKNGVEYFHLLLQDQNKKPIHEVIVSNGLSSESYFAGSWSLENVLDLTARQSLSEKFSRQALENMEPARPVLKNYEAQAIMHENGRSFSRRFNIA